MTCTHTITSGRKGERGSWCESCHVKVYDVDPRPCSGCEHAKKLINGWICKKHLMGITHDMNVMFKIAEGSCWKQRVTCMRCGRGAWDGVNVLEIGVCDRCTKGQ